MLHARSLLAPTLALIALSSMACGDPEVILPDVLRVVTILPGHGQVDVREDVEAYVYFSHPVADIDAASRAIDLECLGAPPCTAPVADGCTQPVVSVSFDDGSAKVARIVPSEPLASDTCYVTVVSEGIEAADPDVGALPVEVRASFQTRP